MLSRHSKRLFLLRSQFNNPDYIDDQDQSFLEDLIDFHKEYVKNSAKTTQIDLSLLNDNYRVIYNKICNQFFDINDNVLKTELYRSFDLVYKGEEQHLRDIREKITEYLHRKKGYIFKHRRVEFFLRLILTLDHDDLKKLCEEMLIRLQSPKKSNFIRTNGITKYKKTSMPPLKNSHTVTIPFEKRETLLFPYLKMTHPPCFIDYDNFYRLIDEEEKLQNNKKCAEYEKENVIDTSKADDILKVEFKSNFKHKLPEVRRSNSNYTLPSQKNRISIKNNLLQNKSLRSINEYVNKRHSLSINLRSNKNISEVKDSLPSEDLIHNKETVEKDLLNNSTVYLDLTENEIPLKGNGPLESNSKPSKAEDKPDSNHNNNTEKQNAVQLKEKAAVPVTLQLSSKLPKMNAHTNRDTDKKYRGKSKIGKKKQTLLKPEDTEKEIPDNTDKEIPENIPSESIQYKTTENTKAPIVLQNEDIPNERSSISPKDKLNSKDTPTISVPTEGYVQNHSKDLTKDTNKSLMASPQISEVIEISDDEDENPKHQMTPDVLEIDHMIDFLIHRCSIHSDEHRTLLKDHQLKVELNGFLLFVNISIRLSLKRQLEAGDKKIFDCIFISSVIIGLHCSVYINSAGICIDRLTKSDLNIAMARLVSMQVKTIETKETNDSHCILMNPDISRLINVAINYVQRYHTTGELVTTSSRVS